MRPLDRDVSVIRLGLTVFRREIALLALGGLLAAAGAQGQALVLSVDERSGLPALQIGGAPALTSTFVWWRANWQWAGFETRATSSALQTFTLAGRSAALSMDMTGRSGPSGPHQRTWQFDYQARDTQPGARGGVAFKFDIQAFTTVMGVPELLPGNAGWRWGRDTDRSLELRFDPPLPALAFERGQKSELRAYWVQDGLDTVPRSQRMTLVAGPAVAMRSTMAERFQLTDTASWPAVEGVPVTADLSFLNEAEKPAGRRGFVRAQDDRLVFADNTPARFWGTNLTAYALFATPKAVVKQQAQNLSRLGFNLVRIHHHDSPWVRPNVFGDGSGNDTRTLDSAMLDRLDWWVHCLKEEGIYVWLDLHVGRALRPGDSIEGFDEIAKGKATADLKGYAYVNPSIRQAMMRFNAAMMERRNAYTGLAYKDEPAIAAVLLTNENDVTHHFGNALLPDKGVPVHNARYQREADAFAAAHGLQRDKTWRSWEQGPSKLFLNDLEHRFNTELVAALRSLGVRVPIATTNAWGGGPLSSLPALTTGDVVDAHSYGSLDELSRDPRVTPTFVDWIAAAHVTGKPLTVTEWNVESFPAPDRHSAPLFVAATAAHQGWDALMQYAYSQGPFGARPGISNWQAFNDPALLATLPAAALLFRQRHVGEARTHYVLAPSKQTFYGTAINPMRSAAIRSALLKGRLTISPPAAAELPWLRPDTAPAGSTVVTDPDQWLLEPTETSAASSDTGELRRDWAAGVYTIDTVRTQAATGWIGGRSIALSAVTIEIDTPHASVVVQSLDGVPINESRRILISRGGVAMPSAANALPYRSQPMKGQLRIDAPPGLKLMDGRGLKVLAPAEVPSAAGYLIDLSTAPGAPLLLAR